MARDVEVNVTASDKTGPGLKSAERSFAQTQKRLAKQQDDAKEKFGKSLGTTLNNIAPQLTKRLVSALDAAGEAAGPLLGAGIIAATPLIAATVSAAIAAGVAVGVAGIGVALVAQDARVQAAGKQLGAHLMDSLRQDAAPFIAPVLDGIDRIRAAFDNANGRIKNIFQNASKFVTPLVEGATRGIDGIISGVDRLVAKSGPVIDALGQALGDLGQSFGDFLGNIDAEDAAGAIRDLTVEIQGLLATVGPALNGLTKLYGFLGAVAPSTLTIVGKLTAEQGQFARRTAGDNGALGESFQALSDDATDYARGLDDAKRAVQGVYEANRDLYGSTTSVEQAFRDANEAVKDNGRTLSLNSEEGLRNRDALSNVAGALQRQYDAYVKLNGEGAGAAALATDLRGRFVALAEKLGASGKRAKELANQLLGIPNVNRTVNVATEQAKAAAAALKKRLDEIHNRSVYVQVAFNQGRINKVEAQLARLGHAGLAAGDGGFRPAESGGRTGGPSGAVALESVVNVNLDGAPVRAIVATAVQRSERRQEWRAKVGRR